MGNFLNLTYVAHTRRLYAKVWPRHNFFAALFARRYSLSKFLKTWAKIKTNLYCFTLCGSFYKCQKSNEIWMLRKSWTISYVTSWVKISLVLWGTHQLCTKWLVLEGLSHLEQSVGNHESSATLSNIVIENFNFTPKDEVSKEDLTLGSLQEIMNALS